MVPSIIPVGTTFGRWTVIGTASPTVRGQIRWLCRCVCGKDRAIVAATLRHGTSRGCRSCHLTKHGGFNLPEYRIWIAIKVRCQSSSPYYEGVTMWPAWDADFLTWFTYVGPRPSPKHSIDRWPDPNGNYEPGNVRWATRAEQSRNLRRNNWLTHNGERLILTDWAARYGINTRTLQHRLKRGWGIERALTEPVHR